jgi:hypothetical protein
LIGTLEEHVLQEMADAVLPGRLVAGPGLDEHPGREAVRVGVFLADDVEAVG